MLRAVAVVEFEAAEDRARGGALSGFAEALDAALTGRLGRPAGVLVHRPDVRESALAARRLGLALAGGATRLRIAARAPGAAWRLQETGEGVILPAGAIMAREMLERVAALVLARSGRWQAPAAPPGKEALSASLIARQQEARRERLKARTLRPDLLAEADARDLAERAVEANLAQGRARVKAEVRRRTDPLSWGPPGQAEFPRRGSGELPLGAMLALTFLAVLAPFLLYFAVAWLLG